MSSANGTVPSKRKELAEVAEDLDAGLRKRKANVHKTLSLSGMLGLPICNSAFQSHLLADVAKAREDILRARGQDLTLSPACVKRRRISVPNSEDYSPVHQINAPLSNGPSSFLDLLWEESWLKPPIFGLPCRPHPAPVAAPLALAPATLIPATISETFSPTLANLKSSECTMMETEDGFGWYVDMDEDDQNCSSDDSHRCSLFADKGPTDALAFSAPVAPKASNHDAALQWAMAADTVDDVLGDLF